MTDSLPADLETILRHPEQWDSRLHPREVQIQLANAVAEAFAQQQILLAEAGTGTGKSLAYLLAALLADKAPVVVSTATRQLQDQLVERELPGLSAILHKRQPEREPLRFTVMFGRSNYLSKRRLQAWTRRHARDSLAESLNDWNVQSTLGLLDEVSHLLDDDSREQIESQSDNCQGGRCPFYQECFYFRQRRIASRSDVIVVNHALLLTDARLRSHGVKLLPDYHLLIVDEAHALHRFAVSQFGDRFVAGPIARQLTRLLDRPRRPGLLTRLGKAQALCEILLDPEAHQKLNHSLMELPPLVHDLELALSRWQSALFSLLGAADGFRIREGEERTIIIRDHCDELLASWLPLKDQLSRLEELIQPMLEADTHPMTDDLQDLHSRIHRLFLAFAGLDGIVWRLRDDYVHLLSSERKKPVLEALPIEPGSLLAQHLWGLQESALLTSATLRSGNSYEHIRRQNGLQPDTTEAWRVHELTLQGGIDWQTQAVILLDRDAPPPGRPACNQHLARRILSCAQTTSGRTMVLLTSWKQLHQLHDELRPQLATCGLQLFAQGQMGRRQLLQAFRGTPSVLLGLDSFWEGVDIPGDDLLQVIITKLPFPVPTDPWNEAVQEWMTQQGRDPFMHFMLPHAILKLRQGIGRLLRSTADRGVVTLLDSRLATKPYGRVISASLPTQWQSWPQDQKDFENIFVDLGIALPTFVKGE